MKFLIELREVQREKNGTQNLSTFGTCEDCKGYNSVVAYEDIKISTRCTHTADDVKAKHVSQFLED